MLSARLDGEPILIHEARWDGQEQLLRAASREQRLLAPCCGAPLVLRWGVRKARHFAHPPRSSCPYERWAEAESPEHAAGKLLLYDWCRRHYAGHLRLLALEHPLRESLQRPDVYFELDDGSRYALEYQRSAITPGEWAERHEAYARQSIHDIWILGENRLADALPTEEQRTRWGAQEPHMQFLKLRAFEAAAAVRSPFEVAWWRGDQQEELWAPQELDARVGREVSPWYRRAALARLRSVTFLDAGTGELRIYRAMRELPRHTDVHMASVALTSALDGAELTLTPEGFATAKDEARLARHTERVARLEAHLRAEAVQEMPAVYAGARLPTPAEAEAEQQRRLQVRSEQPEWRRIVDRYGLKPENLHFLIGIPLPHDTVIMVHRTVWQAFIYYRVVKDLHGSFTVRTVADAVGRRFGLNRELELAARRELPGAVSTVREVVGRFLNLLVETSYLRNDMRSELFRYHPVETPPPPLAFADRKQRAAAWAGLLSGSLHREGRALVGISGPIPLVPALMADRPTPAQLAAVESVARRRGLWIDLSALTYTEASRWLAEHKRN